MPPGHQQGRGADPRVRDVCSYRTRQPRERAGTNLAQAMRRFVLPGLIVVAAMGLLALLTFGVSHQTDTSSIDAQVARAVRCQRRGVQPCRKFPVAPEANLSLALLGSSATKSLADFRGKVVVLNVFASWCGPCATEAPLLSQEQRALARSDATLVGVTYLDNPSASEQFARRYHITYPVLRDVSGSFARAFGITGVPETFVINRQGRVQALQRFPVSHQWLSHTVAHILAERS